MSDVAFRKLLNDKLIQRARDSILALDGEHVFLNDKGKRAVSDSSTLSIEGLRSATNKASQGYTSVISRQGLKNLADSFTQYANTNANYALVASLLSKDNTYSSFVTYVESLYKDDTKLASSSKDYSYTKYSSGVKIAESRTEHKEKDFIIFSNLDHGGLKKLFIKFMSASVTDTGVLDALSKGLDGGHLAGVFNLRLKNVFNLQVATSAASTHGEFLVTAGQDDILNNALTSILHLLNDADYISSNLVYDTELFGSLSKDLYSKGGKNSVSAELQLNLANADAGRALSAIGKHLNSLILAVSTDKYAQRSRIDKLGADTAATGIIKNLTSVVKVIEKQATLLSKRAANNPKLAAILKDVLTRKDNIVNTLINAHGSDSLLESIEKTLVASLSNKPLPKAQKTSAATKPSTRKQPSTKNSVPKVQKPKQSVKVKTPRLKNITTGRFTSLVSLQNLINSNLAQRIKENMGNGNRRDVLNLRTGRLAESAKVERMSQSREGMITAFYTYMKNPYATFSEGGMQQSPRSRDPKLLISKSIREIAQAQVANRMRAVLI